MKTTLYHGFRFPKAIIQPAIWLCLRPVHCQALASPPRPIEQAWHLDEVFVKIAGRQMYLWRAVDSEGEVLDVLVQSRRDKRADVRLMRKLLKNHGMAREVLVFDRLRAYGAAAQEFSLRARPRRR